MRLLLRADATASTGFGHLSRVTTLGSHAIRRDVETVLVASRPDGSVEAFAHRLGLPVHAIDAEPGSTGDADAVRSMTGRDDVIVVDGYGFHAEYLASLRGVHRIVAYIDDLAKEPLPCDVVVNPNVCGRPSAYDLDAHHAVLAGPDFALVHDRFLEARRTRSERVEPAIAGRLLVTMGGSDPPGATGEVIRSLERLDAPPLHVRVVVGAANPRHREIRELAASCRRHVVEVRESVADMAAEMLWADLAVTASGVTASELACVGVPGITFPIAANQEPIALELDQRGLFDVLPADGAGSPALTEALARLSSAPDRRRRMVDLQRNTIDGNGKDRVLSGLLAPLA